MRHRRPRALLLTFGGLAAALLPWNPSTAPATTATPVWQHLTPAVGAPGSGVMVGDDATGQVILLHREVGPNTVTMWVWNGHTWTKATPAVVPPWNGQGFDAAYDPSTRKVVLHVTVDPPDPGPSDPPWPYCQPTQTWTWDGTTWTKVFASNLSFTGPTNAPYGIGGVFGYDPQHGRLIHTGGGCGTQVGGVHTEDTWEWTGSSWTQLFPAHRPAMEVIASAPDPITGEPVAFGMCQAPVCDTVSVQTWRWTGTDWALLSPATSPTPRDTNVALDRIARRIILFGGITGVTALQDTWAWDGATWAALPGGTGPSPRFGASMTTDPTTGRVLLVGGQDGIGGVFTDTWTYTAPATAPGPPRKAVANPRSHGAIVSWLAPVSTGGAPITRYTVTAVPSGRQCATTGALTCQVTGLTNGVSYRFSVKATNKAGTGPASPLSTAVTAGAPTAPRIRSVAYPRPGVATVSWRAPTSTGAGRIQRYVTRVSSTGGRTWTRWVSAGLHPYRTLTGLRRGHTYVFQVRAVNWSGSGVIAAASFTARR